MADIWIVGDDLAAQLGDGAGLTVWAEPGLTMRRVTEEPMRYFLADLSGRSGMLIFMLGTNDGFRTAGEYLRACARLRTLVTEPRLMVRFVPPRAFAGLRSSWAPLQGHAPHANGFREWFLPGDDRRLTDQGVERMRRYCHWLNTPPDRLPPG